MKSIVLKTFFVLLVFISLSCKQETINVMLEQPRIIFIEQYNDISISKTIYTNNYLSWGDVVRSYFNGDRTMVDIFQKSGQNALQKAGVVVNYTSEDVEQAISQDWAQMLGFYDGEEEEGKPRGYKINSFDDAIRYAKNRNLYYRTEANGDVWVALENEDKTFTNIYKLHKKYNEYGFKARRVYTTDSEQHFKALNEFAGVIYATTCALRSKALQEIAVVSDAFYPINKRLSTNELNYLKSLIDPSHFYVIYPTSDGYSQCVFSFPNGRQLNGIDVHNILSVALGTRISEFIVECENHEGLKYLAAIKPDLKKEEREKICKQLSDILKQFYEDTPVSELLSSLDYARISTCIHSQPIHYSSEKKYQCMQFSYANVIKSGFENVPLSLTDCAVFKVFTPNGKSYYDVRRGNDINSGESVLGTVQINTDYDLCMYMQLYNLFFNEVPGTMSHDESVSFAERCLYGIGQSDIDEIKSPEMKKWAKSYGKRKEKDLVAIMNDPQETTRDKIFAAMLLGMTDTAWTTNGMVQIRNTEIGEGDCYFEGSTQHIFFRTDGGWAECVIDLKSEEPNFYITDCNMKYMKKQTQKYYKTVFSK